MRTQPLVCRRFFAFIILIVVISFQALGQNPPANSPPPKTEQEVKLDLLISQARQDVAASRWDAAIESCDKALAIEPKHTVAFLVRGVAKDGKGQFDEAMKDLDLALAQGARDSVAVASRSEAFYQKASMFYRRGEYLKTIDNAYFAILEKNSNADAHCIRAMAYLERGAIDRAIQSADRAINADPNSAQAYSIRGMGFTSKRNLDQAIKDHDKAVSLSNKSAQIIERRAAALLAKGDFKGAAQDIDSALKLEPTFADALCDRAFLFSLMKDQNKAFNDLEAAIKINPNFARAHYLMGSAYLNTEKFARAIPCFDKAISLKASDAVAYCSRGYAQAGLDKHDLAVQDFSKALELDDKLVPAYQGRAKSYQRLKRVDEARADLASVKKLTPEPEKKKSDKEKKKEEKKKEDQLDNEPKLVFKSKPVSPEKLAHAKEAAAKIDALVAANYKKFKVAPNPNTTDEQFVRRIYLDVTGTIPTFPQATKFINLRDHDKRSKLIDHLLGTDGYASHYFNYWADIFRYTDNLNSNVRGDHYRQWIKQSLAENKPWNHMVYEMLTAEGLIWENPAAGYLQRDAKMPLDNMNNTIRIFLGTRIGCAQCHNHPFDRWTQKDFYQMAAFTIGTQAQAGGTDTRYWKDNPNERLREDFYAIEQEEEDRRNSYYRFERMLTYNQMILNDQVDRKITLPKDYAYSDAKPNEVVEPKVLFGKPVSLRKGEKPRQAFARWVVQKDNPRFALTLANRLWKQCFGIGQIEPVDDMMDSTEAENPELMTFLESEMKALNFDMKEFLRIIFHTETYQRQAYMEDLQTGQPYHFPGPVLRRMTAEQVWDSFVTLASPHPYEYREAPADIVTKPMGVDLNSVSAEEMLAAEKAMMQAEVSKSQRQKKYMYNGVLVARASELPSPVPPNHFLRVFGQSDREQISASSSTGSVPQVLFMFNGPITHMLLEKDSTIYNNIARREELLNGVKTLFLTILNRLPDAEETQIAVDEVKRAGAAGYGNVVWSLVNTREFLFVQ
jgi:tetratricopeptide (TPR) repeat protein